MLMFVICSKMENPNPDVDGEVPSESVLDRLTLEDVHAMNSEYENLTADEIFSLIKDIKDPEHPDLTLAQLRVLRLEHIRVLEEESVILVEFTPTIPTCSVAVLIGLTVLRKLQLCVPQKFRVYVRIVEGKHVQEKQVNKQLADKERVAAAMENPNLSRTVRNGVYKTDTIPEHLLIW
jgi:metal-sulfur cluster biosynthetic enzyme